MRDRDRQAFAEQHPHPGDDPVARLRHVNDLFANQPDDAWALTATHNVYATGERTGLTWGDLRRLADMLP